MRRQLGEIRAQSRTLVLGCGFVGGHISRGLARRGYPLNILSRSFDPWTLRTIHPSALLRTDVRDDTALREALRDADEVVFCVGGLQPAQAELDPAADASLLLEPLSEVLKGLAPRSGVGLTFISSGGTVYGNPSRVPVDERQPPRPVGAYGSTRVEAERMLAEAVERDGTIVRVLRCGNLYGEAQPTDRGQGAVGVFIDRIRGGQPIEVFGDGSTVRDYVYVGDLVEVVSRLIAGRSTETVLNVGSGVGTSVQELIRLVEKTVGRPAEIVWRPTRPFDVRRIVLDIERLRRAVAFDPTPLAHGIAMVATGGVGASASGRAPSPSSLDPDPRAILDG